MIFVINYNIYDMKYICNTMQHTRIINNIEKVSDKFGQLINVLHLHNLTFHFSKKIDSAHDQSAS